VVREFAGLIVDSFDAEFPKHMDRRAACRRDYIRNGFQDQVILFTQGLEQFGIVPGCLAHRHPALTAAFDPVEDQQAFGMPVEETVQFAPGSVTRLTFTL